MEEEAQSAGVPGKADEEVAPAHDGGLPREPSFPFPVVAFGSSAGGVEVLRKLVPGLGDPAAAYVVVTHLDPTHESHLADILSRHASLPVVTIGDGDRLDAGAIYVMPENVSCELRDGGIFRLRGRVSTTTPDTPIDLFYRSLAHTCGPKAIAVILSGSGSDGTLGAKDVRENGGILLVQDLDEATYEGMPGNALSVPPDDVLPISALTQAIGTYIRQASGGPGQEAEVDDAALQTVLDAMQDGGEHTYAGYKSGTLRRRIRRRMGLRRVATTEAYLKLLREDRDELSKLRQDVLIGVTRFFRDVDAWTAFADAFANMLQNRPSGDGLRIWIPGCSTGEEAYTVAMIALECVEAAGRPLNLQVFATDLDQRAIIRARDGVYPEGIRNDVSADRLLRFFERTESGSYRIDRQLRDIVVFATQNLISDPPFSRLDVISCRNLLIYLDAETQAHALQTFHFALRSGGLLLLGPAESLGESKTLFRTLNKRERLFQRTGQQRTATANNRLRTPAPSRYRPPERSESNGLATLIAAAAPPSVIVEASGQVKYYHGDLNPFIAPPTGEPTSNILLTAQQDIRGRLRTLLQHVVEAETAEPVLRTVRREGDKGDVEIRIVPVSERQSAPDAASRLYVVSFRNASRPEVQAGQSEEASREREMALEAELRVTQDDMQSIIEELETANEELRASNEEAMSMNEEFQSTNEELETSREELQSLNEELITVNSQLEEKVIALETANNDLENLFASTDFATLFLDEDLCIRRFTAEMTGILNVIESDIGRPISDLSQRVNDPDLLDDARRVMRTLGVMERDVAGNPAYLRRTLPYRTRDNRIAGVVVTYSDVTSIAQARDLAERRERQQAGVAALSTLALTHASPREIMHNACMVAADVLEADAAKVLQLDGEDFVLRGGVGFDEALIDTYRLPDTRSFQAGYTTSAKEPVIVSNYEEEKRFHRAPLLRDHDLQTGISVCIGPETDPWGVMGAHSRVPRGYNQDDANTLQAIANILYAALERDRGATQLADRTQQLELAMEAARMGSWEIDLDTQSIAWDARQFEITGYGRYKEEPTLESFLNRMPSDDRDRVRAELERMRAEKVGGQFSFRFKRPDDGVRWLAARCDYVTQSTGDRLVGVNYDITESKERELELGALNDRLEAIFHTTPVGLAIAEASGEIIACNDHLLNMLALSRQTFESEGLDWSSLSFEDDGLTTRSGDDEFLLNATADPSEAQLRTADGRAIPVLARSRRIDPERDEKITVLVDLRELKQAQADLRQSEQRYAFAVQAIPGFVYDVDVVAEHTTFTEGVATMLGIWPGEDGVSSDWFYERIHPEDVEDVRQVVERAVAERQRVYEMEYRILHTDGRWLNVLDRAQLHGNSEGEIVRITGVATDVTEERQVTERLGFLGRELDHRVKNILANISSITNLTAMSTDVRSPDVQNFMQDLNGRIQSFARAHTLLSDSEWRGGDMRTLVAEELSAYGLDSSIHIDGPPVRLRPPAAQTLAMALHELATNAAKYGALRSSDGRIDLKWSVEDGRLLISWNESGGPQVAPPTRRGFGSQVIQDMLAHEMRADVEMDFAPEGLRVRISSPIEEVQQGAAVTEAGARSQKGEVEPRSPGPSRVLVVEDTWSTAMTAVTALRERGWMVLGPAQSVSQALAELDNEPDAVVLDLNLKGEFTIPVARELKARGIPYVVTTGYNPDAQGLEEVAGDPRLRKPYTGQDLINAVLPLMEER